MQQLLDDSLYLAKHYLVEAIEAESKVKDYKSIISVTDYGILIKSRLFVKTHSLELDKNN